MIIKEIKGLNGYYISDCGKIFSSKVSPLNKYGKIIERKPHSSSNRYLYISLTDKGNSYKRYIHRLVLEAFVGSCPQGMEACHNDGDRFNNHISNLRWDTRKNNYIDREKHGGILRGESAPWSKLTNEQKIEIRRIGLSNNRKVRKCDSGGNYKELAKNYNVSVSTVGRIVRSGI